MHETHGYKAAASLATLVCSRCHEHGCARQLQSRRLSIDALADQRALHGTRSAGAYDVRFCSLSLLSRRSAKQPRVSSSAPASLIVLSTPRSTAS